MKMGTNYITGCVAVLLTFFPFSFYFPRKIRCQKTSANPESRIMLKKFHLLAAFEIKKTLKKFLKDIEKKLFELLTFCLISS